MTAYPYSVHDKVRLYISELKAFIIQTNSLHCLVSKELTSKNFRAASTLSQYFSVTFAFLFTSSSSFLASVTAVRILSTFLFAFSNSSLDTLSIPSLMTFFILSILSLKSENFKIWPAWMILHHQFGIKHTGAMTAYSNIKIFCGTIPCSMVQTWCPTVKAKQQQYLSSRLHDSSSFYICHCDHLKSHISCYTLQDKSLL